jgi:hypothetical protein
MRAEFAIKRNGHAASAKLSQGRADRVVGAAAASIKLPPHNKRPEVSSCSTGWHTYHRLDGFQSNLYHQPEKMLMFALLVDAISCVQNSSSAEGIYRKRKFLEAKNWLCSDRQDWPFSYRNVCDALGYDPDYLRRGLRCQEIMPRPDTRRGETRYLALRKSYHSGH